MVKEPCQFYFVETGCGDENEQWQWEFGNVSIKIIAVFAQKNARK